MTEDLKQTLDRAVGWYRPSEADPAEAVRRAARRHRRRQGSAIVLALALFAGAGTVLFRAFSGPQGPTHFGPTVGPRTSLLTTGVRITTPGDWTLIDLWPIVRTPGRCPDFSSDRPSCLPAGQPILQLSNRDQGLSANLCSKARPLAPPDGAILYVGYDVAALSQGTLVRPWPVSLEPVDSSACSIRGGGQNYAARWLAPDGTPYLAFAYLGPSASSADRDALFAAFDGMSFEPARMQESGRDRPAYVIASGTDRGRPWNLEAATVGGGPELILDLHQPGLGGSLADIRMEDLLKGMAPARLQDGTMAWGAVSPEVARVEARGNDGQTAEGQIVPLPPSMSVGFSAFVVSMPDPTDTTVIAYDATGNEIGVFRAVGFARLFFSATSDTGVLEVNADPPSICYLTQSSPARTIEIVRTDTLTVMASYTPSRTQYCDRSVRSELVRDLIDHPNRYAIRWIPTGGDSSVLTPLTPQDSMGTMAP